MIPEVGQRQLFKAWVMGSLWYWRCPHCEAAGVMEHEVVLHLCTRLMSYKMKSGMTGLISRTLRFEKGRLVSAS